MTMAMYVWMKLNNTAGHHQICNDYYIFCKVNVHKTINFYAWYPSSNYLTSHYTIHALQWITYSTLWKD